MKMNKKGFTLIEMLVVIAIIAVLVSIVVPAVSNSTVKAAAATNAANLRSIAAKVSMDYLEDSSDWTTDAWTAVPDSMGAPTASKVTVPLDSGNATFAGTETMYYQIVNGVVNCAYDASGNYDIDWFAGVAEKGDAKTN